VTDEVLTTELAPDERPYEETLRPRRLTEFVGQERLKTNLGVFISAARARGEALDHALFFGAPGLGKTTLAHIVATEMEAQIHFTSGPVLERAGDLAAMLTNLQAGDVLFIDEIHRLPPAVEEILYPAMEDFELDLVIGQGPAARSVRLTLPRFTLIGATTRTGLLTAPLRDRFGIVHRLEFYPADDLAGRGGRDFKTLPWNPPDFQPTLAEGPGFCPSPGVGGCDPRGDEMGSRTNGSGCLRTPISTMADRLA